LPAQQKDYRRSSEGSAIPNPVGSAVAAI
jgi:hypothetical protein